MLRECGLTFNESRYCRSVSIVVLNWNGLRFLSPCLNSLKNQTQQQLQIILVDNGSTDGSVEFVKENFPSVEVVENHRNLGFAEGMNVGIKTATGDYVIALNNDTRVAPNFIEVLLGHASRDPSIGGSVANCFRKRE